MAAVKNHVAQYPDRGDAFEERTSGWPLTTQAKQTVSKQLARIMQPRLAGVA